MQRLAQVIVAGTLLSGHPPPQFAPLALVAWSKPGLGLSSPRPRIAPGGFTQISFIFSLPLFLYCSGSRLRAFSPPSACSCAMLEHQRLGLCQCQRQRLHQRRRQYRLLHQRWRPRRHRCLRFRQHRHQLQRRRRGGSAFASSVDHFAQVLSLNPAAPHWLQTPPERDNEQTPRRER